VFVALKQIDLTIEAGESVAIVGASGSGKSTLMNIMGCLDRPTSGSYYIGGTDTADLDADALAVLRREHFGFVFQRYHLLSDLSALANVETPAVYAGVGRAERHSRAEQLLNRLGLHGPCPALLGRALLLRGSARLRLTGRGCLPCGSRVSRSFGASGILAALRAGLASNICGGKVYGDWLPLRLLRGSGPAFRGRFSAPSPALKAEAERPREARGTRVRVPCLWGGQPSWQKR